MVHTDADQPTIKQIKHNNTYRLTQTQNTEMGHPDSQLQPYKVCDFELHPSMLDNGATALFSLQAAVCTHCHVPWVDLN